uniref:Uncharacterized protein n=1 Tax=Romanomermis culicivorax TaxID=13658 RepID=A0A915KVD2_ROMCU
MLDEQVFGARGSARRANICSPSMLDEQFARSCVRQASPSTAPNLLAEPWQLFRQSIQNVLLAQHAQRSRTFFYYPEHAGRANFSCSGFGSPVYSQDVVSVNKYQESHFKIFKQGVLDAYYTDEQALSVS